MGKLKDGHFLKSKLCGTPSRKLNECDTSKPIEADLKRLENDLENLKALSL